MSADATESTTATNGGDDSASTTTDDALSFSTPPTPSTPAVSSTTQQTMDRLLPVVNRLHNIFQRCGLANPIDLPQIVVVGSQSSGKSSVLEAIVGFDFLPRGNGVVTRSPILIQLNKLKTDLSGNIITPSTSTTAKTKPTSSSSSKSSDKSNNSTTGNKNDNVPGERWVEFLHAPGKVFTADHDIQGEIISETERVAGKNKQLSPTALIMKVFSTDVVDLTLIDLPGLTKVPVGDQPPDIEKLVRAMIHSYIEKTNTIILAVHPANTDLATSDALQMARRVDLHGVRTLGVITKLDLMDSGTNALDMLLGRVIPLRRGYVGVVNRSQADLETRLPISEARAKERAFFHSHPVYAPHAAKMGSQFLASVLSSMLMEHIRNVLPSIRTRLTSQLADVRKQLMNLGPELTSADDSSATLLHLLTGYASNFADAIDGRPRHPVATTELAGGARISYIFHDRFGAELSRMDAFEGLGPHEIRTALRNATGHRTPLFIPEAAFELLVRRQIHRFLKPSLSCVDMVYDELTRLAEAVESSELARFHRLRVAVSDCTLKLLRERKVPTIEMVHNLVEMEMSYVNTWHPDFIGGKRAIGSLVSNNPAGPQQANHDPSMNNPANPARPDLPDSWVEKNLLGQATGQPVRGVAERGRRTGRNVVNTPSGTMGPGGIIMSTRQDGLSGMAGNGIQGYGDDHHHSGSRGARAEVMTEDQRQELEILKRLLDSYFNIVRKRVQDMVPKAIITFLVQKSKDQLQSTLVSKLYKPNTVDKLMVESGDTTQRRKDMKAIARMLEEALREVNEIRDVH